MSPVKHDLRHSTLVGDGELNGVTNHIHLTNKLGHEGDDLNPLLPYLLLVVIYRSRLFQLSS